jgi:hypothetical protein
MTETQWGIVLLLLRLVMWEVGYWLWTHDE